MGYLGCYNYIAEVAANLKCGLVNAADLSAITSGTHTYIDYGTWNIIASSNSISFVSATTSMSLDEIPDFLDTVGIRNSDIFYGDITILTLPDNTISRFGFDSHFSSAPYIEYKRHYITDFDYNDWSMILYPTSGSTTTLTIQDSNPSMLGLLYVATSGTLENGCLGIISAIKYDTGFFIYIVWNTATAVSGVYGRAPGDKGFRPTGAYTDKNVPGTGGRPTGDITKTDPDYKSDTVTQPGAPDESVASVVRCGFLNVYKMSESELQKICGALYSDTLLNAIQSMFINPLDFIISLMIFPCSPSVASSASNIRFGKWEAALTGIASLGVSITGNKLSLGFGHYDFGSVSIPENWGNFLDYSQTAIELYLPFIGSVNIDVSECMGGSISVEYTVDYFTGMCVANVLCVKTAELPSGKVLSTRPAQHAFQGNCAIQVPLSAESYGSMVGSLINACTQGITNPVGGFIGIAQDAVAGGMRPNISSKGNIVANAGFCSVLYPYVRITRPITAEPASYQEVMGLPSYINTSLGQCTGLCICDGINLQGIAGATENELNRIRQLCTDGVYV